MVYAMNTLNKKMFVLAGKHCRQDLPYGRLLVPAQAIGNEAENSTIGDREGEDLELTLDRAVSLRRSKVFSGRRTASLRRAS